MYLNNNRKIKQYEKRFGIIAVEKAFVTFDDLVAALAVQANEDSTNMPHRLLGEIFYHMGLMTDMQVDLASAGGMIYELPQLLAQANAPL